MSADIILKELVESVLDFYRKFPDGKSDEVLTQDGAAAFTHDVTETYHNKLDAAIEYLQNTKQLDERFNG